MSKNQTINDALKALFLELGGDSTKLADNHKISDYIDDLASVLGGGVDYFDINYTCEESEGTQTLDKTPEKILEAYHNGKTLRFICDAGNYIGENDVDSRLELVCVSLVYNSANEYNFAFFGAGYHIMGDNDHRVIVKLYSDSSVTADFNQIL